MNLLKSKTAFHTTSVKMFPRDNIVKHTSVIKVFLNLTLIAIIEEKNNLKNIDLIFRNMKTTL